MKDIMTAPFVEEMKKTTANMYRLGWDERNGGNISYMLDEDLVAELNKFEQVMFVLDADKAGKKEMEKLMLTVMDMATTMNLILV